MRLLNTRTRVAVAGGIVALAALAAPVIASASTEPPPSEPSEPAATYELDPEREAIVDQIVSVGTEQGLPFDAECVAGIVAQIPDEEVALVTEIVTQVIPPAPVSVPDDADDETEATTAEDTDAEGTMPREDAAAPEAPETTSSESPSDVTILTDTDVTTGSLPELSPETEALGQELIRCVSGDADPALVDEALAAISEDAAAQGFDLECMEAVMSTFDDETLQQLIDNNAGGGMTTDVTETEETAADVVATAVEATDVEGTDLATPLPVTIPEIEVPSISIPDTDLDFDALEDGLMLLVCNTALATETTG